MYILSTFANEIRGRCQILWRGKQGRENGPNLNLKRIQFRRKRKIFLYNFHSSLFRLRIEWFILLSHVLIEKNVCGILFYIDSEEEEEEETRKIGNTSWKAHVGAACDWCLNAEIEFQSGGCAVSCVTI